MKMNENKTLNPILIKKTPRLLFFDNLRAIMVIIVIIFHAAAAYCLQVPFWPFHDSSIVAEQGLLDIMMMFIDVFNMPIFFFIAGFFFLPNIQRKGVYKFLKSKLKRLGIPLLLISIFLLPFLDYIHYYTQSVNREILLTNFIEYWLSTIGKIIEFDIGLLDLSTYSYMTEQFYLRYAWFLSILLAFSFIFSFIYVIWKKWLNRIDQDVGNDKNTYTEKETMIILILSGVIIGTTYFIVDYYTSIGNAFFTLGNIVQFQPIKLGMYTSYFSLGIYAHSKKWFVDNKPLATVKVSAIATSILSIIMILTGRAYFRDANHSFTLSLGFAYSLAFLGLSFLVLFTSLALKYWNQTSSFHQKVAPNSYRMYLVHYIPVMIFPLLLSDWTGIIAEIKFILIFIASVLVTYGISQHILRPLLKKL